jgi:hypothetical protein
MDPAKVRSYVLLNPERLAAMTQAKYAIPYTATLDASGRLAKLVIEAPPFRGGPKDRITYTFTGYGAQAAQTPPVGEIEKM